MILCRTKNVFDSLLIILWPFGFISQPSLGSRPTVIDGRQHVVSFFFYYFFFWPFDRAGDWQEMGRERSEDMAGLEPAEGALGEPLTCHFFKSPEFGCKSIESVNIEQHFPRSLPLRLLTGWHAPVPNNFLAILFGGGKYSSSHLSASLGGNVHRLCPH